jgi:hypothetical protein
MGSEDVKKVMYHGDMYVFLFEERGNGDVVHVILSFLPSIFSIPWFKDGIHEPLERCRGVAHAEKHDEHLKKAPPCFERCLPPVFIADSDIIVSPSYVEFAKKFHPLEVLDTFREVGERGYVFSCNGIEGSIVYDIS